MSSHTGDIFGQKLHLDSQLSKWAILPDSLPLLCSWFIPADCVINLLIMEPNAGNGQWPQTFLTILSIYMFTNRGLLKIQSGCPSICLCVCVSVFRYVLGICPRAVIAQRFFFSPPVGIRISRSSRSRRWTGTTSTAHRKGVKAPKEDACRRRR